jgi:hypothetical protein
MSEPYPSPPLRVLLDENVDRLLKPHFDANVEVVTVSEQGWTGISDLLRRAEGPFDVLVTVDQSLPYQQNLSAFKVAVVVLKALSNAFRDVVELMPKVNKAVRHAKARKATVVTA